MKFVSVSQFAKERNLSERTVRHYCAIGKIEAAHAKQCAVSLTEKEVDTLIESWK